MAPLTDTRVADYARLLVERCLNAQEGWQVLVKSSPLARPLVEEVVRALGRRGAHPFVRLSWVEEHWPFEYLWAEEAGEAVVGRQPSLEAAIGDQIDAWMNIGAPENTYEGSDLDLGKRSCSPRPTGRCSSVGSGRRSRGSPAVTRRRPLPREPG